MVNNELMIVNTEYLPDVKKEEINEIYRISKSALPQLGLAARCEGGGLYKCVFPNGVSGSLAVAKDGSGNLGTIINENGIAGQARWIEQTMNPTMLFAAAALHNLEEKLDDRIVLYYGDGFQGYPRFAPYSKIIVTCGAPEVPAALLQQLAVGGIMVIPVGGESHTMKRIVKVDDSHYDEETFGDFLFVPMLKERVSVK